MSDPMHDAKHYERLGFKCGLEIHQRLATEHKLFCSCDAAINDTNEVNKIERMQRAVAGELGSMDTATRFESGRERIFVYNTFRKASCLVDADEEPPHEVNRDALDIALLIAATFNMQVPDEVEPMRKEVVDGSDPSAFQRTMQIGYSGYLEVNRKKISVPSIFLEEESSGIAVTNEYTVTYNLDRLGVPLIEIDTDPVIATPEEAKEVAYRIGILLRLTGKVQRGIGSIRQDVNLSIREGARVEIKGFQDLSVMDRIIENEVERQINLVGIKKELVKRGARIHQEVEVTDLFSGTESNVINHNIKNGGAVYASRLEGFEGIMGKEINPMRRLGSEISDYAKIASIKGIIHSDEDLSSYSISAQEIESLKRKLGVKGGDAFMLVAGPKNEVKKSIERAIIRANLAIQGVPPETRVVDSERLTTRFLRPLPGGSRMYPETDAKPIEISAKRYEELRSHVPDIHAITAKLEREIGNKQLVEQMLRSTHLKTYNSVISKVDVDPKFVAAFLLEKMKDFRRSGFDVDSISEEVLEHAFSNLAKGRITKAALEEVVRAVPKSPEEVDRLIESKGLSRITGEKLKKLVASFDEKDRALLVKKIMSKYRLNIDGEELNSILKK